MVAVEPGKAIVFNNRRVVHGRSAVGAEQDLGSRRWVQRVYAYDTNRVAKLAIGVPGRVLHLGGGLVRLSSSTPSPRVLELAGYSVESSSRVA
jgi:hypothetical protein